MKKVVFQDDFAFLYLNSNIYSIEAIKQTLETYKEFISSQIGELGNYITLKITSITKDYELKELAEEILNYLISIERKKS